jgi:putative inorganic carbon (HCO3(-)) transporter
MTAAHLTPPVLMRVGVGAAVVLLPFGDVAVPGVGMRLAYFAMALPAGVAAYCVVVKGERVPVSLILAGSGLGVVLGMISTAGGVAPDRAIPLVVISAITLGYATAIALAYRPGLEVVGLDLLVVTGGVVGAMALGSAGALQAAEAGNVVNGRLTGPFSQPNELGIFCAALLPVALACIVTATSVRRAALLGLAAFCLAAAWMLSMSRGAWIGGVTALVCLAVCEPATRRVLAGVGGVVAATCAAAMTVPSDAPLLGVLGSRIRSLGDPTQNQYDDRPLAWAEALRQAAEHPWLGGGPGSFQTAATASVSKVSADPLDHPHNLLLTVLVDRGAVGLALALVVVAGCVLAARQQLLAAPGPDPATRAARTRSIAVLAALAAVAVHGAFDMPLRNPIVGGLVWTLLGMAVVVETTRPAVAHGPVAGERVAPRRQLTTSRK